jgi:hypothetical protein
VLKGQARRGFNGVTGRPDERLRPVEIYILLPDNYLRIDSDPESVILSGFSGNLVLNKWTPQRSDMQISVTYPPEQIHTEQENLAHLMAGMLAVLETACHLTAGSTQTAGIELLREGKHLAWMDLEPVSGAPLRVRYEGRLGFPRALTQAELKAGLVPPPAAPESVEVTLTFDDRRSVEGVSIPFRITRAARNIAFEELRLETVALNTSLSKGDFVR